MKILSKKQMKALMEDYPGGGIVFAEYTPDVLKKRAYGYGRKLRCKRGYTTSRRGVRL